MASERRFQECHGPYEYSDRITVRNANRDGMISLAGVKYRLSSACRGEHLGLSPIEDGIWEVYFRRFRVGVLDQQGRGAHLRNRSEHVFRRPRSGSQIKAVKFCSHFGVDILFAWRKP